MTTASAAGRPLRTDLGVDATGAQRGRDRVAAQLLPVEHDDPLIPVHDVVRVSRNGRLGAASRPAVAPAG